MPIETSTITAFLIGVATGAAGQYFAEKYTDQRREKEAKLQRRKLFHSITEQMPALIGEMKADLSGDGHGLVREFFVLPSSNVMLGGTSKPRFTYFENEHTDLRLKLDLLARAGFIQDITENTAPIFLMQEEFVDLMRVA